ncbi:MAG: aspartate carbamoyltransferase regulatory subunit, partial [Methanosphaera sp.]|nr:aspartate carbamoyltransferase regulatory subunit [Methanosphaera sp.]
IDKISLIAPDATINIIRDYEIVAKDQVKMVKELNGIVKCTNPKCISNTEEPIESKFYLVESNPITVRCHYCERLVQANEIYNQFEYIFYFFINFYILITLINYVKYF